MPIPKEIVKNRGPLLFGEIYRLQKESQNFVYNNFKCKTMSFGRSFHLLGLFRKWEIGQKIAKNHGLPFYLLVKLFNLKKYQKY